MTEQPNVLWISTHDINPHLGCYRGRWPGAEDAHTPNLDALAAQGVRYDNAYAAAPVCAPSRSAIYTGCYPTAIGTMPMRTKAIPPADVRLFTEYFRAAGYWTTNNWFTDLQVDTPPTAFDDCSPTAHWRGRPEDDMPFFASFHGMITHESQIYLDDEEFAQRTSHVAEDQRHDPATVQIPPYHPDTHVFRRAWARYHDLITEMDHWVGQILSQLDEDGLADSTIVVFWSEHGLGMPRHKRWANEAGLREPLIVRWPGVLPTGVGRTELVQLVDLAPTMLQACGLDVPEHMQGRPFLTSDGDLLAPNRYAFGGRDRMDEQEDSSRTVRGGSLRYTRHRHPDRSPMQHCQYPDATPTWKELRQLSFEESESRARGEVPNLLTDLQRSLVAASKPAEELFDVDADPFETTNLVDNPAYRDAAAELRSALDQWIDEYGDYGLIPEDELADQWRPGGTAPVTATPECRLTGNRLVASCATPGASLAWTDRPPSEAEGAQSPMTAILGGPTQNNRRWRLYSGPVDLPPGARIWVGAWRLGYRQSVEVNVSVTS